MTARRKYLLHSWRNVCAGGGIRIALFVGAAIVVVVVGEVGLFSTSSVRLMVESWINIHLLFCGLLVGLVLARPWCICCST
jgi:hypothetical protein